MGKLGERLFNGLIKENPTFILMLGMCPTLAVTTSAMNGVGMGLSTTVVLIMSNLFISALRKVIPDKVRIPAFIVIVASFVTIVQFLVQGFLPDLYDSLGIYIPLIVVNCIILGRAESFASKNPVLDSAADGLFTGLGFTLAITLMGLIREVLGAGSILGYKLWDFSIDFFGNTAGAFLVYGLMIAGFNALYEKFENNRKRRNYIEEMQASALAIQAKESEPAENADVKEA